jgi:hypothetical protein
MVVLTRSSDPAAAVTRAFLMRVRCDSRAITRQPQGLAGAALVLRAILLLTAP